ncbi:hypothetical protein BGZ58_004977 [Dissophora ornata]|nr:hypothetical protein BGZ58_004977 [Dissophora ornata]
MLSVSPTAPAAVPAAVVEPSEATQVPVAIPASNEDDPTITITINGVISGSTTGSGLGIVPGTVPGTGAQTNATKDGGSGAATAAPSTILQPAQMQDGEGENNSSRTEPPTPTSPTPTSPTQTGERHAPWPEHPRHFLDRVKETVSKAELGNLLSKGSDPFHHAVLRIHMESFDFRRDPIDLALRKFLLDFHFPKEAQQIDRVLEAFASRYHACNPHLFRSADVVYTIAFSLMLLHTDAHNKNVRYKMTKEQYVKQAKTIDGVNTIPADILEVLYDNITFLKFVYAEDDMDVDGQRIAEGSIARLAPDLSDLIPFRWPYYWKGTIEMVDNVQINNQFTRASQVPIPGLRQRLHSQQSSSSSGHGLSPTSPGPKSPRPESMLHIDSDFRPDLRRENSSLGNGKEDDETSATDSYAQLKIVKSGILIRKIDIEHGKKSSVRGWRDLGVILSGSQLLFFTDVGWFQQQRASLVGFNPQAPPEEDGYFATEHGGSLPPMPQALISTEDSIAVVDSSYQKYPHVFRLVCPLGKQYLFRADSEHEMNDWMAKINYASAFKTAGVRLRNYRVSWASDVFWIKDEQGRHQLKRRRQRDVPVNPEPLDGRAQLIQTMMKDIDRRINTCSASLAAELRLARGLEVMIPLQNSTRQKIVQSATVVGKRLRNLMLERTKLDCFRTILERDLAVVPTVDFQDNQNIYSFRQSMHANDEMSGSTAYSRTTFSSGTLRPQPEAHLQGGDDLEYKSSPDQGQQYHHQYQHQHLNWNHSNLGTIGNMDQVKEDEEVPESTGISQSGGRGSARPKLNIPELHRSVSEYGYSDGRQIKDMDIPMEPMAIQAAIIDAARGTHSNSAMSSPDLNHFHGGQHLSPSGPLQQSSPSQRGNNAPSSPTSSGQSMLSPEPPGSSRSRALSMPGQRPNMPRTVSIYSSSSQTANRLRKIFEQGLTHFKFSQPSSSGPSAEAAGGAGMSAGGSSLKTSFSMDVDDAHA